MVGWLAEAVGCAGFAGSLCGGGSAANLMGLALAREAKLPANDTGVRGGVVYASEQVHMSIPKAVAMLGIGRDNLRLIPADGAFRMQTAALRAAIAADRQAEDRRSQSSPRPARSSPAPSIRCGEIAAIARTEDPWLHVDGAYGVPGSHGRARKI